MFSKALHLVSLVFAMLCLAAVPSLSWAQNQVAFRHYSERMAFATFATPVADDETGCLVTSYDVRVFDDTQFKLKEGPGKPITGSLPGAGISIVEFNTCVSQVTEYYECSSLDPSGWHVSPSLDTATLDTSFTCFDPYDFEFPPFELVVNITWEATGPVVRRFRHDRITEIGEKNRILLHGERREAVATGSILQEGENLIADESDVASIEAVRRMAHILLQCRVNPELCRDGGVPGPR
jgi:hypothetical protein